MDRIAEVFLKLIYKVTSQKQFNDALQLLLKQEEVSKLELPKMVLKVLKEGKDLPQNGQEALNLLTYLPISALRQSPLFEKIRDVMSPEEKKKIPSPSSVWGPQGAPGGGLNPTAEVTAGLLDFPRKKLPEAVWDYSEGEPLPRLRPDLRAVILGEARRRTASFGAEMIGCNLYGGAATYQYHAGADIDCSIYIDWETFDGDYEIMEQAFKTVEIEWEGFKLHLFVKPPDQPEQMEVADAVYDVLNDEWRLPPLVLPGGFDPEIFFQPILEMAEKKARQIDQQMGIVGREWEKLKKAIEADAEGPREPDVVSKRIEIQKGLVKDEVDKLVKNFLRVWDGRLKLHDQLRKHYVNNKDIDQLSRFQFPEVCWKYLDQAGYVDFLKVLTKAHQHGVIDTLLSDI